MKDENYWDKVIAITLAKKILSFDNFDNIKSIFSVILYYWDDKGFQFKISEFEDFIIDTKKELKEKQEQLEQLEQCINNIKKEK